MAINLRYDLRFQSDSTLARRLEVAWRQIDRVNDLAVKPRWWDAFHANRMKRGIIRHRSIYRIKARIHVALRCVAGIDGAGGDGLLIFIPFYAVAWLLAPRSVLRSTNGMGEYDAFLLKCEIEDLQDEIQRRVNKRKRTN
jgi:hypothetical protein